MKTDIIFPCYSEGKTIAPLLQAAKQAKHIGKIIVVDDGSDKQTKEILQKIPGIVVLTHQHNQGKTAAIKTGVKKSRSNRILLMDSDIKGMTAKTIDSFIEQSEGLDMALGVREKAVFWSLLFGVQAFTGDRVMFRKTFEDHPEVLEVEGFLFEAAINQVLFEKQKVDGILLKGISNPFKIQKRGPKGLLEDMKMWSSILSYLGFKDLLFQLRIGREIVPERKKLLRRRWRNYE